MYSNLVGRFENCELFLAHSNLVGQFENVPCCCIIQNSLCHVCLGQYLSKIYNMIYNMIYKMLLFSAMFC